MSESKQPIFSKHFPGHENRTIYISGIPDACTKSQFKQAIAQAFATPAKNRYDSSRNASNSSHEVELAAPALPDNYSSMNMVPDRILVHHIVVLTASSALYSRISIRSVLILLSSSNL